MSSHPSYEAAPPPGVRPGPVRGGRLDHLVRAAAAGDRAAWESLVERFTPAVRAAARGFRLSPPDVDDVVQATWLAAFTNIGRLRRPEAIGAWLVVTARREALRSLQRSLHEVLTDDPQPQEHADDPLEETLIDAELLDAAKVAVRRLPERQRRVVEALFCASTPSYARLASRLDMPIGAIGPTRERALARLRRDADLTAVVRRLA